MSNGAEISALTGRRLGPYAVTARLGAGGMGEVYRARDTRLDRDVAIKILPTIFVSDPDRRARFEREARMLAALNHPHIGAIYGLEEHAGVPALVLELVEGPTLADRLLSGRLSVAEAITVAAQIATALDAAHEKGIVHRDLKPANIKITPGGVVKVLDFGLAKSAAPDPGGTDLSRAATIAATREGVILGTPAYMSPEQARGKPVDKRADIWAFGCVLYEMLTGRGPFGGETIADTIASILERDPDWEAVPASTPQRVDRLLRRCLAKDPTRRLRDIGEARVELDEALNQRPAAGAGVSQKWVWWRSRPALAVAAVALTVLAIANIDRVTGLPGTASGVRIESLAVLPFTTVDTGPDMEYQSDGLTDRIIDQLSQLPDLKVTSHRAVFLYKGRDVDAQEVGRELGVEAVLTGRVTAQRDAFTISLELIDARDNSHIWGEQYAGKVSDLLAVHATVPLDIAEKLQARLGGDETARLTRVQTTNSEAYQLYLQGRYAWERWNREGSKAAVSYFEQAIAKDPNYGLAYSGLADAYLFGAGTGLPAREANQKARAAVEKALALDPALGEAHASLAQLLANDDWDFGVAEREFKRAIELSPSHIEAHHMYSHYLLAMGRNEESLVESRRVLALDPLSPVGLGHLAYHYLSSRQYDEAISTFQTYLAKEKNDVAAYAQLGDAYYQKGMMREAFEQFLTVRMLDGASPDDISALRRAYVESGIDGYLREWVGQLKAGRPFAAFADHAQRTTAIAGAYARLRDRNSAFEWLEKAYAEHDPALVHLREYAVFDNLRTDPRFADLLRRIGLPPV